MKGTKSRARADYKGEYLFMKVVRHVHGSELELDIKAVERYDCNNFSGWYGQTSISTY